MGIAERSRARVEDLLSELEVTYDAFPVNQTTFALPADRYEAARTRHAEGFIDAYVEVANDEGDVLHVPDGGELTLPRAVTTPERQLEGAVQRAVADRTGVECSIEDVASVTIAGISNADAAEAETLYHLLVVFAASHDAGAPPEGARWMADARDVSRATV